MYDLSFNACKDCINYFDLRLDNLKRYVSPGHECDYCTDLTGRPNYVPQQLELGEVRV